MKKKRARDLCHHCSATRSAHENPMAHNFIEPIEDLQAALRSERDLGDRQNNYIHDCYLNFERLACIMEAHEDQSVITKRISEISRLCMKDAAKLNQAHRERREG